MINIFHSPKLSAHTGRDSALFPCYGTVEWCISMQHIAATQLYRRPCFFPVFACFPSETTSHIQYPLWSCCRDSQKLLPWWRPCCLPPFTRWPPEHIQPEHALTFPVTLSLHQVKPNFCNIQTEMHFRLWVVLIRGRNEQHKERVSRFVGTWCSCARDG